MPYKIITKVIRSSKIGLQISDKLLTLIYSQIYIKEKNTDIRVLKYQMIRIKQKYKVKKKLTKKDFIKFET